MEGIVSSCTEIVIMFSKLYKSSLRGVDNASFSSPKQSDRRIKLSPNCKVDCKIQLFCLSHKLGIADMRGELST